MRAKTSGCAADRRLATKKDTTSRLMQSTVPRLCLTVDASVYRSCPLVVTVHTGLWCPSRLSDWTKDCVIVTSSAYLLIKTRHDINAMLDGRPGVSLAHHAGMNVMSLTGRKSYGLRPLPAAAGSTFLRGRLWPSAHYLLQQLTA